MALGTTVSPAVEEKDFMHGLKAKWFQQENLKLIKGSVSFTIFSLT